MPKNYHACNLGTVEDRNSDNLQNKFKSVEIIGYSENNLQLIFLDEFLKNSIFFNFEFLTEKFESLNNYYLMI